MESLGIQPTASLGEDSEPVSWERREEMPGRRGGRREGRGEEFQALGREKVPAWLAANAQQKLLALQVGNAAAEVGAVAMIAAAVAGCSLAIVKYQK